MEEIKHFMDFLKLGINKPVIVAVLVILIVLFDDGVKRVLLSEIATSRIGYETQHMSVLESGSDSFVIGVKRQRGANVLEVVKEVREVVEWLNSGLRAPTPGCADHDWIRHPGRDRGE